MIETARPVMEAMVEKAVGVKVVTMRHDISTRTGEEVFFSPWPGRLTSVKQDDIAFMDA